MLLAQRDELQSMYEQLSQQSREAERQWSDRQQVSQHIPHTLILITISTPCVMNSRSVAAFSLCVYQSDDVVIAQLRQQLLDSEARRSAVSTQSNQSHHAHT